MAIARKRLVDYSSGETYDGEWSVDGKRHGRGALEAPDGSLYAGEFANGLFHGWGALKSCEGALYEGQFQAGRYHGYGVFTGPDGMKFEGQFREGKVKGGGLVTFPDGSHGQPRNEGRFEDQACVERRRCAEAVERARQSSAKARTLAEDIHCTDGD